MKDYCIYRYYPSGNVVFCGTFSNLERAQEAMSKMMDRNPAAMYRIHEKKGIAMTIYVLDYINGDLLRIRLHALTKKVIESEYRGAVESWLEDNQEHFGIKMSECYFMAVDDEHAIREFNMI